MFLFAAFVRCFFHGGFFLLIAASLFYYKRYKKYVTVISSFFLLAVISLVPVATMYFMYLNQVQNDRLGYYFSYFASIFLCLVLALTGRKLFTGIVILFTILNIFLLQNYIDRWVNASAVQRKALETFMWVNANNIYVLNQPNYFKGAYIYRDDKRIDRSLLVLKNIDMKERIQEIAWANLNSLTDNITVKQNDANSIEVTLNEWGRWFWINGQGAYDYADKNFEVSFDELNHSYVLKFNTMPSKNDAIIYYTPDGWKRFVMQ